MNRKVLVPIVEGYSEVESVPVLLRRRLSEKGRYDVEVARPVRVGRYKVVREGELERAVALARQTREGCRAILILLDADDDCPAELGPALLARARACVASMPVAAVLAKAEFESWFVGSLESLRSLRGISADAQSPDDPESIRGAKGYLTRQMEGGRTYVEVDDQPAFTAQFDLMAARARCPSLDKFLRDVDALLASLTD